MQNFLAKCAILAFLAGGFAFTGDATRIVRRGRGILDATTIPDTAAGAGAAAPATAPASAPLAPATAPTGAANGDISPSPPARSAVATDDAASSPESFGPATAAETGPRTSPRPSDAPVGAPIETTIPAGGPGAVTLGGLAPGDRVILWIGRASGRGRATMVAFDLVDPLTGDAIEMRHASGEEHQATLAPFRRVRITGSVGAGFLGAVQVDRGRIECRKSLCLAPLDGTAADAGRRQETTGPVVAITIVPAGTPAGPVQPAPAGDDPGGHPAS